MERGKKKKKEEKKETSVEHPSGALSPQIASLWLKKIP